MNMSITYTGVLPIALADIDFTQGSAAITTDLYLSQGEPMNEFRPTGITYTDTPDGSWPALKSIHFIYEREGMFGRSTCPLCLNHALFLLPILQLSTFNLLLQICYSTYARISLFGGTMFRALVRLSFCLIGIFALLVATSADSISDQAKKLHFSSIVVDTHDDTTQRFFSSNFDLGKRNPTGHIDIPRMREGGLNAIFFSIWIDGRIMGPRAIQKALDQVDAVHQTVKKYPKDLVFAHTAEDVRRAHEQDKIAVLIGIEGGHMLGNDIRMVRVYSDLGVRYMTLSHFYNDEWADSSTDKPVHNGLTDYGKEIVREMNRQGMLVDISHVSDKTFYDALEVSKAPLIASHSSCRALCNHPRDMTDDMIKALAAKGGVIQINYEKSFIDQSYNDAFDKVTGGVVEFEAMIIKKCGDDAECGEREQARLQKQAINDGKLPHVSWERIIEHIDHVVKLVGPDHVGLGSDFDGADMPEGMEDCTHLPQITEALLRKGYSTEDIRKILGGNTLRVLAAAEQVSREIQSAR
jgi:membrane dipeptidase